MLLILHLSDYNSGKLLINVSQDVTCCDISSMYVFKCFGAVGSASQKASVVLTFQKAEPVSGL